MNTVLVCGSSGFIGSHLVKRLQEENCWVIGVDIIENKFGLAPNEFITGDLKEAATVKEIITKNISEIYQFAADMGGAEFIFNDKNNAQILRNNAIINLNVLHQAREKNIQKIFFPSSACVYPKYNQLDPLNPLCSEESAYPAAPDSEYGWEKLFSERLYLAYQDNYGLEVRIARLHNIFGPEGTWRGGREKAPAAICRKVAEAKDGDSIEIWGDGCQTRSFLFIDECVEGIMRLMKSNVNVPVNLGSQEMISINDFARLIIEISGKKIKIKNVKGLTGVRGRNSDNKLISQKLGWQPCQSLRTGIEITYKWIVNQLDTNQ